MQNKSCVTFVMILNVFRLMGVVKNSSCGLVQYVTIQHFLYLRKRWSLDQVVLFNSFLCFLFWQLLERNSPGFASLWILWTNVAHWEGEWRRLFLLLLDAVNVIQKD